MQAAAVPQRTQCLAPAEHRQHRPEGGAGDAPQSRRPAHPVGGGAARQEADPG